MKIKVSKLTKSYGSISVLDEISFQLEAKQKVGLVGANSTGKSTLLKILAGDIQEYSGDISYSHGVTLGYMPQDTSIASKETIYEYVHRVSGMADLEIRLEDPLQAEEAVIEYERREGYTFYYRLDCMLSGFGLNNISGERNINLLSSGQKSKVFMIGVLLSDPDVLLLDEPTNNLDLPALIWLENFIVQSQISCMIVSHDRLFLDRVVDTIFEIDPHTQTLHITNGKYSDYLEQKKRDHQRQLQEHYAQQKEIKRLEEKAQSLKSSGSTGSRFVGSDGDKYLRGFKRDRSSKSGKRAKAIEKRIEQMDTVEKPFEQDAFRIPLDPSLLLGGQTIQLTNIIAGYPEDNVNIGPISLTIPYGTRITILGMNGVGKSTLLRTISGEMSPIEGIVHHDKGVVLGNLTQEHNNLPKKESITDYVMRKTSFEDIQYGYALLAKFGFMAQESDKRIEKLSPGGRARLLFAVFSAISANVLLLDEPTNHLDLEALEALEEALQYYQGTIILVSHDRRFLKRFFSTEIYLLSNGKLIQQESFESYESKSERKAQSLIQKM